MRYQDRTAIMNSVVKLPMERIYNGANLNMRFQGKKISTENLTTLINTYFRYGGMPSAVQHGGFDNSQGSAAASGKAPRTYSFGQRLFGRIHGLSEIAQDEIISRTEFEMCP